MTAAEAKGPRRPPRPASKALVVSCSPQRGAKGDVWAGRKWLAVQLSCGHMVRKVAHRRFLIGEQLTCQACQRAIDQAQLSLLDPAGPQ